MHQLKLQSKLSERIALLYITATLTTPHLNSITYKHIPVSGFDCTMLSTGTCILCHAQKLLRVEYSQFTTRKTKLHKYFITSRVFCGNQLAVWNDAQIMAGKYFCTQSGVTYRWIWVQVSQPFTRTFTQIWATYNKWKGSNFSDIIYNLLRELSNNHFSFVARRKRSVCLQHGIEEG